MVTLLLLFIIVLLIGSRIKYKLIKKQAEKEFEKELYKFM